MGKEFGGGRAKLYWRHTRRRRTVIEYGLRGACPNLCGRPGIPTVKAHKACRPSVVEGPTAFCPVLDRLFDFSPGSLSITEHKLTSYFNSRSFRTERVRDVYYLKYEQDKLKAQEQ